MKNLFVFLRKCTSKGFEFISNMFVKGVYFYLYLICLLLKFIFRRSVKLDRAMDNFRGEPTNAESCLLLVFLFVIIFSICELLFFDTNEVVKLDTDKIVYEELRNDKVIEEDKKEEVAPEVQETINYDRSLFKQYGDMQFNQIDFNSLLGINDQIVGWLSVDTTNINYPIVQSSDNDFYLNHNINKANDSTGWPFMDYRNDSSMTNKNTIFYGHNLLNNTSFGSISRMFNEKWFKSSNHKIIFLTRDAIYTYEVFSIYYSEPENYYLQINLEGDEYLKFLDELKYRSMFNFNKELSIDDKIITLSTCTDDNKGRRVVHAKLVEKVNR